MTNATAEKIANVVVGAAVVGAAYVVIRTPSLRRLAWRLAVTGLTGTLPAWFRHEIEQGWRESAPAPVSSHPTQ
jgi:hypothetical protein